MDGTDGMGGPAFFSFGGASLHMGFAFCCGGKKIHHNCKK